MSNTEHTSSHSSIRRLFAYIRPDRTRFINAVWTSIANKILDLMPPLLVGWVIDTVRGDAPNWVRYLSGSDDPMHLAATLAILSICIFALESIFQWAYQWNFMSLAQTVQHRIRMATYRAMQVREMAFFENHRLGDTLAILNDDTNQLERFLNNGMNQLIQLAVVMIFAIVVLFITSWPLAIIGMLPIPLIIFGSMWYQKQISPKYQYVRQMTGALNSRIENNIAGMPVIKSFTAESFEYDRVRESSEAYLNANVSAIRFNVVYVPLIRMAVAVGFAGVLLLGSYWILNGASFLTVGELVVFSMLIQRMLWPLTTLGSVLDDFERAKASLRRLFSLLDHPPLIRDPEHPVTMDQFKGHIEFNDVRFSYPIGDPIFKNLTLHIPAGQSIGIAGTTGSGKSTLIKLLLRFYEPNQGSICLDSTPIDAMTQTDLRKKIALVSQDIYLFYGSIYDNIAYGCATARNDDVIRAAKQARLHDFIMSLPDTYDTLVGERGIKLSGGQRQRLSIARAILKDAPIMVFDEATSSVDTETEKSIQENLTMLIKGKTAIIIAHRLSTIKRADRIVVLDGGGVSEDGNHEELLSRGKVYADLWQIQTGEAA